MPHLQDRVAIVTGSSRGIGRAIALKLAAEGARVVVNHRSSRDGADEVVTAIKAQGGTALAIQADVSQFSEAERLVKETVAAFGRVDILVNNAGTTRDMLLPMMKEQDWDLVIDTNLKSAYNTVKAVIRPMMKARRGRIISITSVVGLSGQAGQTNYAASKAGLIGFTKSVAREYGSRNITANCVAPGYIPTALTNVMPQEQKDAIIKQTPLGRMGTAEDVAEAVAFLASDGAAFITGQTLSVDGGLVMQ